MKHSNNLHKSTLSSSMEDYLEAIKLLSEKDNFTHVKDIASYLKIKMPSVTSAMKKLQLLGLVSHDKYNKITLTDDGASRAEEIYSKHSSLYFFLNSFLQLNSIEAGNEACELEHYLSDKTNQKLGILINYFREGLENKDEWAIKLKEKLEEETLDQLQIGEVGEILKIEAETSLKRRLQEMGLRKGESIKLVAVAPLNDPLKLELNGYLLSLRKSEAAKIIIKKITDQDTADEQ